MSADRRLTLARPDLAARDLEGLVRAEHFAIPRTMQLTAPVAGLRAGPDASAEQDDQLLFGELFDVLEVQDGWAWGQARRDGYVGFVEAATLSPELTAPTHWVSALRAYAFESPSIKARAVGPFSLNALVTVQETDGAFLCAAGAGWFHDKHLRPLGETLSDFVSVAASYLGAPYLWGGRDSLGIDCSGLVQRAAGALRLRPGLPARRRHAGGAGRADITRASDEGRPDLLVRSRGHHVRPGAHPARQRIQYGRDDRTADRGGDPQRGRRSRGADGVPAPDIRAIAGPQISPAMTLPKNTGSTLPPDRMITAVRPPSTSLPASRAASATLPPGSITSFRVAKA